MRVYVKDNADLFCMFLSIVFGSVLLGIFIYIIFLGA